MSRLPQLLRYFRLPPTASNTDLRRAYLRRVKEVHPDATGACPKAFQQLQEHFHEASELLNLQQKGLPPSGAGAQGQRVQWAGGGPGGPWAHGGFAASSAASTSQDPQEVSAVGLPGRTVYPLAAFSIFAAAAAPFLMGRRSPSPSAEERPRRPDHHVSSAKSDWSVWPALKSGPWSVADAMARPPGKGVFAPSRSFEYLDSDSFYAGRAKGHLRAGIGQRRRLGEQQGGQIKNLGYEAAHEPHVRDGVEMLPVHLAAEGGHIWWLEQCGAKASCRGMLSIEDTQADTPLHHGASAGQANACLALLRLGADPTRQNASEQLPEELAAASGHLELAGLLRRARGALGGPRCAPALRHPDGLGELAEPPEDVVFTGLRESENLCSAFNMATGLYVAPAFPASRALQERLAAVDVVRGYLQATEYDLEEVTLADGAAEGRAAGGGPPAAAIVAGLWRTGEEDEEDVAGAEVSGLLFYEPPGSVSADAPGHWGAVRRRASATGGSEGGRSAEYWRLDSVRGPFRLAEAELAELVGRYQAWRVVRGSSELRAARSTKLTQAKSEAVALVEARSRGAQAQPLQQPQ